eukprot:CAMPEP_0206264376 /NCGR_PEP_ID=MMETSP0047_2-20121206/29369_1 /ASSEMBLY_ACC=CAM_ASM_000192 /TAXON_ID=195065 /ORGANISM="Chroomonas mesostigmatica_cf, Strain CCMP1168" /LENGTH=90 /DNA_ID=CAMNT_0053692081 /DNA_START=30 /DNA_END=299 /DNA_ORIENTATION=+
MEGGRQRRAPSDPGLAGRWEWAVHDDSAGESSIQSPAPCQEGRQREVEAGVQRLQVRDPGLLQRRAPDCAALERGRCWQAARAVGRCGGG